MAATATQQVINDGPRNLNVKYTIAGTTGDTTAGILVNVSGFNDADGNALGANSLTLVGVDASLTGFSCNLLWDATTNVNLIEIPSDEPIKQDFSKFGGIKDNSGTGSTGDVLFTTTGYTASGDGGHIYLKFKKT
jgi:hypothetical protein